MNKVDIISEVLSQFYDANLRDAATRDWIASQIDKKIENYYSENEFSNGNEDIRSYKHENLFYYIWDPYSSKLAAAIFNGLEIFPFINNTKIVEDLLRPQYNQRVNQ